MDNKEERKEENKLTIEIHKYQNLLEILKEKKKVLTLVFVIAATGILLFWGITKIVLSIKRLYPYSDITTNAMGTTTIRSENKNVSYFLFNTAELWANSGIKVKKGQTITIKASGKKHSAIHHLVGDAQNNSPRLRDPWVGTEGFPFEFDKREERDRERAKYRIMPNANQDVLLLQIVKDGIEKIDRPIEGKENENRFIVVGNKMENIHIDFDGTLYFAVNDVVLDDQTIIKMMRECNEDKIIDTTSIDTIIKRIDSVIRKPFLEQRDSILAKNKHIDNKTKVSIDDLYDQKYVVFLDSLHISKESSVRPNKIEESTKNKPDTIYTSKDSVSFFKTNYSKLFAKGQQNPTKDTTIFLSYPADTNQEKTDSSRDTIIISKPNKPLVLGKCEFGLDSQKKHIELYGYFMYKYTNAWYEDNVGSFLILVETVND